MSMKAHQFKEALFHVGPYVFGFPVCSWHYKVIFQLHSLTHTVPPCFTETVGQVKNTDTPAPGTGAALLYYKKTTPWAKGLHWAAMYLVSSRWRGCIYSTSHNTTNLLQSSTTEPAAVSLIKYSTSGLLWKSEFTIPQYLFVRELCYFGVDDTCQAFLI